MVNTAMVTMTATRVSEFHGLFTGGADGADSARVERDFRPSRFAGRD
jgi:hypothetical protein